MTVHRARLRTETPEQTFTRYATKNVWRDSESLSGPGSTLHYTEVLRKELPQLIEQLRVAVVYDAPCGDFNWMREVQWEGEVQYIGADIAKPLIDDNQAQWGGDRHRFLHRDITMDALPDGVDLWFCRDALFHLSYDDIFKALRNFAESEAAFLLTTTHTDCAENTDILTGDFRLLNLELPPFNFPKPQSLIKDYVEGFPVRYMGLWRREDIQAVLR